MGLKLEKVRHSFRRQALRAAQARKMLRLQLRNRTSNDRVTCAGGPVVSLTTFGSRLHKVYLTIESIVAGTLLPSRLILWLDEKTAFDSPPGELQRLVSRGLEIRLCPNYGPHKKYYPYVQSQDCLKVPLVTADDDVMYPKRWLEGLARAHHDHPEVVNCYRARVIELNEHGFAKYETWKLVDNTVPNLLHVAVGVGGVIYPAALQKRLRDTGTAFIECCPRADDIWLHAQALRAGIKVRQIETACFELLYIPGSQKSSLQHQNVCGGENDLQIQRTYGESDLFCLRTQFG